MYRIGREGETHPADADDFARLIVRLLNESADAAKLLIESGLHDR